MKKALITGITGQDGSYLAELLLARGYAVYGLVRRVTIEDQANRLSRIGHLLDSLQLVAGSLESYPSLYRVLKEVRPDEIYHLAAQSFVSYSFDDEFSTMTTNINGTHGLLAASLELVPEARFYFAGSSEMFGTSVASPQNEDTPFHPRSVYGISKVAGFHLVSNYRENNAFHACTGILYNHESPRRGFEFVTRKITSSVAKIKKGLLTRLELGNLDARRDWGHAREYVEAMWKILQQDVPQDFVIATGQLHSVRDFCQIAFAHVGLDYEEYVVTSPKYFRRDTGELVGDAALARRVLDWQPTVKFADLVGEMVEHDLHLLQQA